jgi:hypothetical protein
MRREKQRKPVKVSSTGGAFEWRGPIDATQPAPAPQWVIPATRQDRLWTAGYPPHQVAKGLPPRSWRQPFSARSSKGAV